jgi:hypothetical protein
MAFGAALIIATGAASCGVHHWGESKDQELLNSLVRQQQAGPVYRIDLGSSANIATKQDMDQLRIELKDDIRQMLSARPPSARPVLKAPSPQIK